MAGLSNTENDGRPSEASCPDTAASRLGHPPDLRSDLPVTQLLSAASHGDHAASEALWKSVYVELRRLAASQLAAEVPGHTLQPTVLVHEVFLKLVNVQNGAFENRRYFFAAAARAMRCIRIDDARRRKRQKRGGGGSAGPLEHDPPVFDDDPDLVLAVDEALARLRAIDPRKVEVVELRYFAGLSVDETAVAMGVSPRTVDMHWRFARAWLHKELGSDMGFVDLA